MYTIIRRRQVDPARQEEALRRAEESLVPRLRAIPGFVAYTVATSGADVTLVNVYQDRAGAEESTRVAEAWVEENRPAGADAAKATVVGGPVLVRQVTPGGRTGYGVIRDYRVDPGNVAEIARRAEEGFLPLISAAPGFVSYSIIDAGEGRVLSLSGFADQAGAEASVALAADWVKEHLAPLVPNPPEVTSGQVRLQVRA